MNKETLMEYLANLEHERWSNWQAYVHNLCIKNDDGSLTIPKEYVEHWNYEINTKYEDLPENIKNSDRKEVYKRIPILENLLNENQQLKSNWKTLKEWLIEQRKYDHGEDKYGDTLDKMNELESDKE